MSHIDPSSAAAYTVIGICLILIGALLTAGPVTIEQRGAVLAGIFTVLIGLAWRVRRHHHRHYDEDDDA